MVKASTDNVAKSKKKIAKGDKGGFFKSHLDKDIFKKRLFQVSLVTVGILVALAILEIVLRINERKIFSLDPCTSLDRDFHHVLIPNSECRFKTDEWDTVVKINSHGHRDDETVVAKPAGVFRILALGDSFTMGHGVNIEDTYISILEKDLNKVSNKQSFSTNKKVEIVNGGVFGYSPLIYNLYLQKQGLSMSPDMVIVFFSLTDFWEDRKRLSELKQSFPDLTEEDILEKIEKAEVEFKFDLIGGASLRESRASLRVNAPPAKSDKQKMTLEFLHKLKRWARTNSKIYATFVDFIKKKNQPVQQDVLYQGDPDRDIVAVMRGDKISQDNWEELFKLPAANLITISEILAERGIKFVVVLVPEAVQVSDKEWPNRKGLGLPEKFHDPRGTFQKALIRRLAGEKIQFINLLPDFQASGVFPLYFTGDGHFRESGHRLASEVIDREIRKYLQKEAKLINL